MRAVLCICSLAPRLALNTRVTILMHWREIKTTSNTARLALLGLKNGELRIRGEHHRPLQTEDLIQDTFRNYLLYPTSEAVELSAEMLAGDPRPVHLIVPDGSWKQARKVATRERDLAKIPRIRLRPGRPSEYALRTAPFPEQLCTYEAVARALGVIEGQSVQKELENFFAVMVERTLWSRGKIKTAECRSKIPAEAVQEFFEAGCRGRTLPDGQVPLEIVQLPRGLVMESTK